MLDIPRVLIILIYTTKFLFDNGTNNYNNATYVFLKNLTSNDNKTDVICKNLMLDFYEKNLFNVNYNFTMNELQKILFCITKSFIEKDTIDGIEHFKTFKVEYFDYLTEKEKDDIMKLCFKLYLIEIVKHL